MLFCWMPVDKKHFWQLPLSLMCVSCEEGRRWLNYKRGKRRHMIFSQSWPNPKFWKQGLFRWRVKSAYWKRCPQSSSFRGKRKRQRGRLKGRRTEGHCSAFCLFDNLKIWLLLSRTEKILVGLECSPVTYLQLFITAVGVSPFPSLQPNEFLDLSFTLTLTLFFLFFKHGEAMWQPTAFIPPIS